MAKPDVIFNIEHNIGIITLNRPEAYNALTLDMVKKIYEMLLHWQDDPKIHAVILQSNQDKIFCAGGDIKELYHHRDNLALQMDFFTAEYQLNNLVGNFSKPYIALLTGLTMGGGAGISMHGHYPIASEDFVFAMPECAIGFYPDVGISYLLCKLPFKWQDYIGVQGGRVDATTAYNLGLVKAIIPKKDILEFKQELFANPNNIVKFIKKNQKMPYKRTAPEGKNASYNSPLSMAITKKRLLYAYGKSLVECLEQDYKLTKHFMQNPEFYEGVRAMLIDKDKKPKWQYHNIATIPSFIIDNFFK